MQKFPSKIKSNSKRFRNILFGVFGFVLLALFFEFKSIFSTTDPHDITTQQLPPRSNNGAEISYQDVMDNLDPRLPTAQRMVGNAIQDKKLFFDIELLNHCYVSFGDKASFCYIFPKIEASFSNSKESIILVSILSNSINFEQREWIRNTWLRYKNINIRPYFIVANPMKDVDTNENDVDTELMKKIEREFIKYHDLIILRTNEGYKDVLPYKSLGSFQIFESEFSTSGYNIAGIFKTDDDSFVQLIKISETIEEFRKNAMETNMYKMRNKLYFYGGECVFHWKIKAKQRNGTKNPVPWEIWPFEYYPDFCKGPGYILSWDLLLCVNSKVKDSNEFYPFYVEDVSTGIYVEKCNGTATNIHQYPELDKMKSPTDARNGFINHKKFIYHHVTTKQQFDMFWNWESGANKRNRYP